MHVHDQESEGFWASAIDFNLLLAPTPSVKIGTTRRCNRGKKGHTHTHPTQLSPGPVVEDGTNAEKPEIPVAISTTTASASKASLTRDTYLMKSPCTAQ